MEPHKENIIELRNIRSLSGKKFYIPDYQRGYRWTGTQALAMLNDFADFIEASRNNCKSTGDYYCLQPVVVKPKVWVDSSGNTVEGFEVIDGQQRLTTLFLLLTAIFYKDSRNREEVSDFQMFSVSYQTRNDSQDYLDRIYDDAMRERKAYECLDFYHISIVFESFISELSKKM